jgi:ubiquinone/menaquinone biosynthesis C-methylase UbiE
MKSFWNQRYSEEEFVYGKEPNEFFKQEIHKISPGKLLLPAEGEGRNAVYASKLGWEVTAFDFSEKAKNKAEKLAKDMGVSLNYITSDFDNVDLKANYFDCIGLIYVHLPNDKRSSIHRKLLKFLKKNGLLILEGFSKNQIKNATGGPINIDLLFSKEDLMADFSGLDKLSIYEREIELQEGIFHKGIASVIRIIGEK